MPEINDALKFWPIVVVGANCLMGWVFWSAQKHFVSKEELADYRASIGQRVGALESDMAVAKSRLETMPTKDDLGRVELAVGRMEGSLQALERNMHLLLKCQLEPE